MRACALQECDAPASQNAKRDVDMLSVFQKERAAMDAPLDGRAFIGSLLPPAEVKCERGRHRDGDGGMI